MIELDNVIGLVVEAESVADARMKAEDLMVTTVINHYSTNQRFVMLERAPLQIDGVEGGTLLMDIWEQQDQGYMEDVRCLAMEMGSTTDHRTLLEQLQFRSACFRLGSIHGYPNRIYDPMGEAIPWRSYLQSLMEGLPDENGNPLLVRKNLWVVMVCLTY